MSRVTIDDEIRRAEAMLTSLKIHKKFMKKIPRKGLMDKRRWALKRRINPCRTCHHMTCIGCPHRRY